MFYQPTVVDSYAKLIRASTDTSISRGTNSFDSITCATSTDSSEIFTIPAGAIVNPGDELIFEAHGELKNNEGNTRQLTPNVTLGANLVWAALGMNIVTGASGTRSWRLMLRIIMLSDSLARLVIEQRHNNIATANVSVQGTPLGSLSTSYVAEASNAAAPFVAASQQALLVTMAWSVTSSELWVKPQFRSLRAVRYRQ